jgi:hypothetical protein
MINREPLGIRKLDVQAERRQARRDARLDARQICESFGLGIDESMIRALNVALIQGWERGVAVGAARTRDRVQESINNGRLTVNA